MTRQSTTLARAGLVLAGALLVTGVTACSSGEEESMESGTDTAMVSLCEQMVADGLSAEEATALAEAEGYTARIGSIDGEPQPTTRDYRPDRFTFEVVDGAVVSCQYG